MNAPNSVAILIDGGYLRALAVKAGRKYNPDFIVACAHQTVSTDENLFRILYYDCPPYQGRTKKPVSGDSYEFQGNDAWLRDLASRDLVAVRRGVLKFRGWKPRRIPVATEQLTDDHFAPDFEQKGVDMRIGLDIATLSAEKPVHRIVLITADTDFIPAMKHGRKSGLQIVAACFPDASLTQEFKAHLDFVREIGWPP